MNSLISIIVPVYNSSPYLYNCIQSVLQQTYQNFELILIDDGSQDESKSICEKICCTDKRIRFISQNHKGVSAARNRALKFATGEYLFFLDSDDAIHPCLLETMYIILTRTNALMAAVEYYFIYNNELPNKCINQNPSSFSSDYIHMNNQTSLDFFVRGYINTLYGIGGIMVRRMNMQSMEFDEQLQNGEDTKFIYQMLLQGADIIILNKKWYYYRKYKSSNSKKRTLTSCQSMYRCEQYIRDNETNNHRNINALNREHIILLRICEWYITGLRSHNIALCKYLRKISAKERNSRIFHQLGLYDKINFFLIFHFPPLYWMFHISHRLFDYFVNASVKIIRILNTYYQHRFLRRIYYVKNISPIDKLPR